MMRCQLSIVRYPRFLGWAGFLSMAWFRLPLFLSGCSFWKLMGCGRNGSFDKQPDWRQWAVLRVWEDAHTQPIPASLEWWWRLFGCEQWHILLEPIAAHGLWDGKAVFGNPGKSSAHTGQVAVLTRASIRLGKLKRFWSHVDPVAARMHTAPGFVVSVGIGEVPWIKQATFSLWENTEAMKQFAYGMPEHAEVVRKTRREDWYSEELFARFKVLDTQGSLQGKTYF